LPPLKALPAMFEAWLNLSHREKARVFIMVRTRAMTTGAQQVSKRSLSQGAIDAQVGWGVKGGGKVSTY
jgi:hypothetical protein